MKPLSVYIEKERQKIISPYLDGKILDLGCGYGAMVRLCRPMPENYLGVDHQPLVKQWFSKNFPNYQVETLDLETSAFEGFPQFNTIVMAACLEHLKDPNLLFSHFPKLLKPGGKVLITTPTPFGGKIHTFGSKMGLFYREAAEDHKTFFDHETLKMLLNRHYLKLVEYHSFVFGGNQLAIGQLS